MTPPAILLHFGGAGTYTAVATIAAVFVVLFALTFLVGSRPQGTATLSREWAARWLKASLPRLLITGVFCAGLFAASSLSGGARTATLAERACEQPVAPFTTQPVTPERLRAAITGMGELAGAAGRGDVGGAQALFFGTDTHNVTHDIDAPLGEADQALSKDLCRSMVTLEMQLAGDHDMDIVRREAETSASLLEQAAIKLDLMP